MSMKNDLSRRDFMKDAAKVAAGVSVGAAAASSVAHADVYKRILPQTVLGANEVIRTGHIGTGIMGRGNLRYVMQRDDMLPIAICDIWPQNKMGAVGMAKAKNENVTDHHHYEEIIANPDVDAVVVATPDHWHALPAIQACDAGKAVYCEKPMTTTIAEALAVVDAAKRNNTIMQGGTLQRSGDIIQEAVQLLREGYIGKVFKVDTYYHDDYVPAGIGNPEDSDPPEGCDWILHQGWVEHVPFNTNRHLYGFRFFFDYAGARLTDWGIHLVDIALWALGENLHPKSVSAVGGKYVITDNRTTPDTIDCLWDFDDFTISFSHRACNSHPQEIGASHGMIFHGTQGTMELSRAGYKVYPQKRKTRSGEVKNYNCEPKEATQTQDLYTLHWANFAEAIRDGKQPVSHAEALAHSTIICHMANCAYRVGERLYWDPATMKFKETSEAAKKANEIAYRPYNNGYKLA